MKKKEKAPEVPFIPLASQIINAFDKIQADKEKQPDSGESPSDEVPAMISDEEGEAP